MLFDIPYEPVLIILVVHFQQSNGHSYFYIRLATKFLRFFDIFFFIYFSFLRESAVSYVYTIGICGSSPTI